MNRNLFKIVSLCLLAAMTLAACGTPVTPEAQDTPAPQSPAEEEPVVEEPVVTEEPVIKTIYIGSTLVECEGVAPQKCMQVKEDPNGEYQLFYDQIEGFEYEEGYLYTLKVSEEKIENPPADASNIKWILVEVLEKTADETASLEPMPVELTDVNWQMISLVDENGTTVAALPDAQPGMTFQDGAVGGSSGCNTFSGSVEISGNSMTFGPLATTLMACSEPLMNQETLFLTALARVASFQFDAGNLVLLDGEGQVVMSLEAVEPLPLVGTLWEATAYNNGKEAVVGLIAGTKITIQFDENGQVAGTAGCNNYFGSFSTEGGAITIGQLANTEMACMEPEGVMEQETQYLQALPTAATFSINQEALQLRTADDALVALFQAVTPTPLVGTPWLATGYNNGKGGFTSILLGTELTATFAEDGSLAGSAGCNNYMTSYQVDGSTMQISPAATTRKMCAEPQGIMEQEAAYTMALEKTATFEIVGGMLSLYDTDGARLADYQAHPLVGDSWALMEIQYMNDTSVAPPDPLNFTIEFLPDNSLAIRADCNQVTGKYTTTGPSLSIELGASTMAFCGEDSLDQEYLQNLGNVASWIIEGDSLYLATKMDSSIMHFVRIP